MAGVALVLQLRLLSKFGGTLGMTVMIGFFAPEPWQWLLGLFPPFWVSKAYWMAVLLGRDFNVNNRAEGDG